MQQYRGDRWLWRWARAKKARRGQIINRYVGLALSTMEAVIKPLWFQAIGLAVADRMHLEERGVGSGKCPHGLWRCTGPPRVVRAWRETLQTDCAAQSPGLDACWDWGWKSREGAIHQNKEGDNLMPFKRLQARCLPLGEAAGTLGLTACADVNRVIWEPSESVWKCPLCMLFIWRLSQALVLEARTLNVTVTCLAVPLFKSLLLLGVTLPITFYKCCSPSLTNFLQSSGPQWLKPRCKALPCAWH